MISVPVQTTCFYETPMSNILQIFNHAYLSAGALTSFCAGFVKIRWTVWSEVVISVITAVQAGLLLLMGTTDNIWLCYTAYVLFRGFYQFLVPIAT